MRRLLLIVLTATAAPALAEPDPFAGTVYAGLIPHASEPGSGVARIGTPVGRLDNRLAPPTTPSETTGPNDLFGSHVKNSWGEVIHATPAGTKP